MSLAKEAKRLGYVVDPNTNYTQIALNKYFANPDRHKPTALGLTVKNIFSKLTVAEPEEGAVTHVEAAEIILKKLG